MADATIWPWVALLACLVALLGLVGAVVGMRRWGGPSQRYEVPDGAAADVAGPRGERVASDWDELSAGVTRPMWVPTPRPDRIDARAHRVIDPCTKVDGMSEHDDDHGHSVAAWTAVAHPASSPPRSCRSRCCSPTSGCSSAAPCSRVVGVVAGKVLSMAGYGSAERDRDEAPSIH